MGKKISYLNDLTFKSIANYFSLVVMVEVGVYCRVLST